MDDITNQPKPTQTNITEQPAPTPLTPAEPNCARRADPDGFPGIRAGRAWRGGGDGAAGDRRRTMLVSFAVIIAGIAAFHYWAWGRGLSKKVAYLSGRGARR